MRLTESAIPASSSESAAGSRCDKSPCGQPGRPLLQLTHLAPVPLRNRQGHGQRRHGDQRPDRREPGADPRQLVLHACKRDGCAHDRDRPAVARDGRGHVNHVALQGRAVAPGRLDPARQGAGHLGPIRVIFHVPGGLPGVADDNPGGQDHGVARVGVGAGTLAQGVDRRGVQGIEVGNHLELQQPGSFGELDHRLVQGKCLQGVHEVPPGRQQGPEHDERVREKQPPGQSRALSHGLSLKR